MDQNTQIIHSLEAELDRLNRKILFLERENRSLRKEAEDAQKRESFLLDEITRLEAELEEASKAQIVRIGAPVPPAASVEEWLNPMVGEGRIDRPAVGIEGSWEPLMVAFTDPIFVETNLPDLILYCDDSRGAFVSPSGQTVLRFPITQESLDRYNIISVRVPTEDERTAIIKKYEL